MNVRMWLATLGVFAGVSLGLWGARPVEAGGAPSMERENKKMVERIFKEALNKHDLGGLVAELGPTMVDHDLPPGTVGPAGTRAKVEAFLTAFPDIQFTVESLVAEGDLVAGRGYFTGTQKGPFAGIPASGKAVKVPFMDVWRVEKAKVVEYWGAPDRLSLLQQLGAIPAPKP